MIHVLMRRTLCFLNKPCRLPRISKCCEKGSLTNPGISVAGKQSHDCSIVNRSNPLRFPRCIPLAIFGRLPPVSNDGFGSTPAGRGHAVRRSSLVQTPGHVECKRLVSGNANGRPSGMQFSSRYTTRLIPGCVTAEISWSRRPMISGGHTQPPAGGAQYTRETRCILGTGTHPQLARDVFSRHQATSTLKPSSDRECFRRENSSSR